MSKKLKIGDSVYIKAEIVWIKSKKKIVVIPDTIDNIKLVISSKSIKK